ARSHQFAAPGLDCGPGRRTNDWYRADSASSPLVRQTTQRLFAQLIRVPESRCDLCALARFKFHWPERVQRRKPFWQIREGVLRRQQNQFYRLAVPGTRDWILHFNAPPANAGPDHEKLLVIR